MTAEETGGVLDQRASVDGLGVLAALAGGVEGGDYWQVNNPSLECGDGKASVGRGAPEADLGYQVAESLLSASSG